MQGTLRDGLEVPIINHETLMRTDADRMGLMDALLTQGLEEIMMQLVLIGIVDNFED
jgi:hypothetical protein